MRFVALLAFCAALLVGALAVDGCSTGPDSSDASGTDAQTDVDADSDAGLDADGGAPPACRSPSDIAAIGGVSVFDPSACTTADVCTAALQAAMDAARDNQQALYLPSHDYHVVPTGMDRHGNPVALLCVQSEGKPDGGAEGTDGRYHPCILIGSTCDPSAPSRIVLDDATMDQTRILEVTTASGQFNDSYNQIVRGVVLTTAAVQHQVVALDFRAAQGSTVQDTLIDLSNAPGGVGIVGGPGSGGSIVNVTIKGGATGLDYSAPGQQTTVTAVSLIGQTGPAIIKGGQATFVGVGVSVSDFAGQVAIDQTSAVGASSALTLVDSSIAFATNAPSNTVVGTARSVYLENVYLKNATKLVVDATDHLLPTPTTAGAWQHVPSAAFGEPFGTINAMTPQSHVWTLSGCGTSCVPQTTYDGGVDETAPPSDVAGSNAGGGGSNHGWSAMPGIETPSSVVVSDVGSIQAALDAHANDGVPIVLAKGEYVLTQTLHLHAHSKLVGIAPTLSILEPDGSQGAFAASTTPLAPLVDTEAGGDTLLAYVGLYDDPLYQTASTGAFATGVVWSAGSDSAFVSPFPNFLHNTNAVTGPLFDVRGGGRFYDVWGAQESLKGGDPSTFRIYRISGVPNVRNDARFYEFDIEHAGTLSPKAYGINAEIDHATGVYLYGVKNESPPPDNCLAIDAHDSTDVHLYGHGGNGAPGWPGNSGSAPALYDFTNVTNSRIANLVEAFDQSQDDDFGQFTVLRADGVYPFGVLERPVLVIFPRATCPAPASAQDSI